MKKEIIQKSNSLIASPGLGLSHLLPEQIENLTRCFSDWFDEPASEKKEE